VSSEQPPLSKLEQRIAERRAAEAAKVAAETIPLEYADLTPDASDTWERSEQDLELDRVIDGIDIIDAYNKWCGKSTPNPGKSQTESIKVSCPTPGHRDRDPSAWLNTVKKTWFCGSCQIGGDVYDIAAYHFGFPVPGYKIGAQFHELRRQMAGSYGYTFVDAIGVKGKLMVAPYEEPPETPATPTETEGGEVAALLTDAAVEHDAFEDMVLDEIVFPTLNWKDIVQPDTFLWHYCEITSDDDIPEEYNFWNGLLALGMAAGRDVRLVDRIPVYGNFFLCLLGHTGDGKSRSYTHVKNLLRAALPHKWDDIASKGTRMMAAPASAEALIHAFSKPLTDPSNPKNVIGYAPVRGLVEFNELSSLTGRAGRMGNVLKPTLMEFYDSSPVISTTSMTTGVKEAHEPFASVFTTTQPRALKELIRKSDADSGFLNRWVFASGAPKTRHAIGGAKIDVLPTVPQLQDVVGWIGFGKDLNWTQEAHDRFTQFFHDVLQPKQQADESGLLTRIDLLLKKLILLMAVNVHEDVISEDTVDRVLLMYPYLVQAYAIPAAQIGNTLQIEVHEEILRQAKRFEEKYDKPISVNDLNRLLKRKKYPMDLVLKVLDFMVKLGELEPTTLKGPGRPTVRYKYVG
jgi:hypothetical protein